MISAALAAAPEVHAMRDLTCGGVATALVEIANQFGVRIVLDEKDIPVREPVHRACEILGLDPLYVACEGRMLIIAPPCAVDGMPTQMSYFAFCARLRTL